jgi:hypothetical protein
MNSSSRKDEPSIMPIKRRRPMDVLSMKGLYRSDLLWANPVSR